MIEYVRNIQMNAQVDRFSQPPGRLFRILLLAFFFSLFIMLKKKNIVLVSLLYVIFNFCCHFDNSSFFLFPTGKIGMYWVRGVYITMYQSIMTFL